MAHGVEWMKKLSIMVIEIEDEELVHKNKTIANFSMYYYQKLK